MKTLFYKHFYFKTLFTKQSSNLQVLQHIHLALLPLGDLSRLDSGIEVSTDSETTVSGFQRKDRVC